MIQQPLFEKINQRIVLDREEGDYAYFHALILKLEYLTKIVTSGIIACIGDDTDRYRYSLEHKLVRADSIGTWEQILNLALVGPPSQLLISDARRLRTELTKNVTNQDWRYIAVSKLNQAAKKVGVSHEIGRKVALRQFFSIAVQLRNRSRGHGAPTAKECNRSCAELEESMNIVVQNMKLLQLPWVYLFRNRNGKYRVSPLLNNSVSFNYLKRTTDVQLPNNVSNGVFFNLNMESNKGKFIHIPLIFTDPNLIDIFLPNGNYRKGKFQTLSYVTNKTNNEDGSKWIDPPARLPQSETEGQNELDHNGSILTNAPPSVPSYISRVDLEQRLLDELCKSDRHSIITLTGSGGIGKTSIAIRAIQKISEQHSPPYEVVLWISARDMDLLDSGPKPVSRSVFKQQDIGLAAAKLLTARGTLPKHFDADVFFQECLKNGAADMSTLFVLDNFETLENPADVFEWIDSWINIPNKVLITTRFRDFTGDYSIKIEGMLYDEAVELIDQHAKRLNIENLLDTSYKKKLILESAGHPYVMKILLGEIARKGRLVKPERVVANADNLLNALFERTYAALSPAAQHIFLLLSSWRVFVPEIAVEAVLLRPGVERINVLDSLEELIQYSLVDYIVSDEDKTRFIGVPLAAAMYGRGELEVSPLNVTVNEDRKLLMEFGPGKRENAHQGVLPRIDNLVRAITSRARISPKELEKTIPILEYIASRFPKAYLRLTDLLLTVYDDNDSKERAKHYMRNFLKNAEISERHQVWLDLADICHETDDITGEIHALCEAAFLPISSVEDIGKYANRINKHIRELKDRNEGNIRSGAIQELIEKFIQKMESHLDKLSATNCSRLAWLYRNVGNAERAQDVAMIGIQRDPANEYCKRILLSLGAS